MKHLFYLWFKFGDNALMRSASMGHLKSVGLLMTAGANVKEKSKSQWMHSLSLCFKSSKAIDISSKAIDISSKIISLSLRCVVYDQDGWSALMLASVRGHVEIAKLLITTGSDKAIYSSLTSLLKWWNCWSLLEPTSTTKTTICWFYAVIYFFWNLFVTFDLKEIVRQWCGDVLWYWCSKQSHSLLSFINNEQIHFFLVLCCGVVL